MSHHKPDPSKSVNLTVDGLPVTVPEGTTILEAARKVNVQIPTLCDHPDLCRRAICRICVVECDGRGKLFAACANTVYEGLNVVTNNERILNIRKTILELIIANHPQDCLNCIRNTKCELQSLADSFAIRTSPFSNTVLDREPPEVADETLVRDMDKCVKCGRCVEVCQEIQTVKAINTSHRSINYRICTPYGNALTAGPCTFCGQCAEVCPVGAIYGHDQSNDVLAHLFNSKKILTAAIAPSIAEAVCLELGFSPGTITQSKIVTALKLSGFKKVYSADTFMDLYGREEKLELFNRIKNAGKLPMISGCTRGFDKFVNDNFPDLEKHLPVNRSSTQVFGALAKESCSKVFNAGVSDIITISVMPCIAKKPETRLQNADGSRNVDFVLTPQELAGLIRQTGVDLSNLAESPFDAIQEAGNNIETGDPKKVKTLVVRGLANARIVLESIRPGKCDADYIKILSCHNACGEDLKLEGN